MPHRSWKVLNFCQRPKLPRYSHASAMPLSAQAKLSELILRFDNVAKNRPADAVRILWHCEQILQMFDA
jgi:hypothetical protein